MPPSKSIAPLENLEEVTAHANEMPGEAAHECVSEEALSHLKTYKYSSVDKSLISNYILKHYVRSPSI